MTSELSLNIKYVFQNSATGKVHTEVFNLTRIEEEYFQENNLYGNGCVLIARCPSINTYDKHKTELFDGDILKISGSIYVVKILGSAAALLYPDQDKVFEYFHNLSPNNFVGELVGDIYSMPNLCTLIDQEKKVIALEILEEYKEMDGIVIIPTPRLDKAIAELEMHAKTLPLLDLFLPMLFHSPYELHEKAKELDCVLFEGADDIQYLKHIAAKMYENGYTLFYFKKAFSEIELKHLVMADNFSEAKNKENIYISSNQNTGVLYVVENLKKESKK